LVAHRAWWFSGIKLPRALSVGITFVAVLFAWVMFRAASVSDALTLWQTMLGMNGFVLPSAYAAWFGDAHLFQHSPYINGIEIVAMLGLLMFCMSTANTPYRAATMIAYPSWRSAVLVSVAVITSILALSHPTTFLYYQF
ncbi:MAG: hypothetical protein ACXWTX_01880, partial [Gallionella sp.]